MRLRLAWHAPTVIVEGFDADGSLAVSNRLCVGRSSRCDVVVVPRDEASHLGGHVSYIIELHADVWRLQHTGHIGSASLGADVVTSCASAVMSPNDVIELRNPDGDPLVRLVWEPESGGGPK